MGQWGHWAEQMIEFRHSSVHRGSFSGLNYHINDVQGERGGGREFEGVYKYSI